MMTLLIVSGYVVAGIFWLRLSHHVTNILTRRWGGEDEEMEVIYFLLWPVLLLCYSLWRYAAVPIWRVSGWGIELTGRLLVMPLIVSGWAIELTGRLFVRRRRQPPEPAPMPEQVATSPLAEAEALRAQISKLTTQLSELENRPDASRL